MNITGQKNRIRRTSVWASGGVLFIAAMGLLGYLPGWRGLGSIRENYIPMAPATAFCFIGLTLILILLSVRPPAKAGRVFCSGVALLISVFGLLESLEYFTGTTSGLEEIFFPVSGYLNGIPVGRMSPVTGAGFVLSGLGVLFRLLITKRGGLSGRLPEITGIVTLAVGFVYTLTYLYGYPLLYSQDRIIPMALTTAAGFILLGIAIVRWTGGFKSPFLISMTFLCLTGGIIAVGLLSYKSYERNYRAETSRELQAIIELKVSELSQWRRERMADGNVLYNNPVFSGLVERFLSQTDGGEAGQPLRIWLEKLLNGYDYSRIFLLDSQGNERLILPAGSEPLDYPREHSSAVLRSGQVVWMDFHRHGPDRPVVLSVQVPVFDEPGGHPLGVLVLQIDPQRYLYPFIGHWPVPNETSETLLVRRDGDAVLFLNELRFRTDAALKLRIPLTQTNVPAVMAVLGTEGVVNGIDYRGERVVAAVQPVPDTPWFMVARQDAAAVFAPVRERLRQVIVMIAVLLFGSGALSGMAWRHQRARFYREKAVLAEDLRVSNRDLEQFAYIASHDLQEPLRMVANYMQLLERRYKDKLDQDAHDFIGYAVDGAVRMQQLIDSLLDYSRLQTRKKPFETVDLNKVLQRVLRDLEGRILETGASIISDPLPHVRGDGVQLGLVFQNFITNALKFRGEAAPEIHISAEEISNHWKISIRDNGIGIEAEHQERIFKIFQRLHSRAEYPGTGIGLAVCRRIIERHGGETGVESEVTKGSTFWFILPKQGENRHGNIQSD